MVDDEEASQFEGSQNEEEEEEEECWKHPLTYWLRDCAFGSPPLVDESDWRLVSRRQLPLHFRELHDGVLMNSVLRYIDPSTPDLTSTDYSNCDLVRDSVFRQKQLRALFEFISRFYRIRLQQLIVIASPNLSLIARSACFDESIEEINKLILLLLGCAIQSEKKRNFVDRITKFDQNIQIGLAKYIKQITQTSSIVVSAIESDRIEVFRHLERVMKERDALTDVGHVEHDSDEASSTTTSSSLNGDRHKESIYDTRPTSPNSFNRQAALDLAHVKQEMRQWRHLAENKDEENRQLFLDNEEKTARICQLENERLKLMNEARQVKVMADDLQAANFKIEKLQSLEGVEKKLREAQDQKEFHESRYEAVCERNRTLEETIAEMERNLETLRYETKDRSDIEKDFQRSKSTVKDLQDEISKKNGQIEDLMDEQFRLEHDLKEREERISQLESNSPSYTPRFAGSLADQLEDAERDEVAKLRAENRKLRAQTEGASPDALPEIAEISEQLEAEKMKLAEARLENQKLVVEREQIDGTLDRVSIELEQATIQIEAMREERDATVKTLHEARRKFAQFQAEFGEEAENKVRALSFELKEAKRRIEEVDEMKYALEKSKDEKNRIRFELDEIIEEKNQLEQSLNQLERSKKSVENEKNLLKTKNAQLEDDIEDAKLKLLNADNFSKRLDDRERLIQQLQEKLAEIETDQRTVQQQLQLELKKTQKLREDLVTEKSRAAEIVGKLRSLCAAVVVNGGKIEELDDAEISDDELINRIDNIMMNVLTTAKRESDTLRIQQNKQIAELADLKKDIEKLRRSESVSLSESDDRVQQLTQENINMKEQIFLLQEKIRELGVDIAAKCNEITMAKNCIEELNRTSTAASANNTEFARLQVSLRNAQLQEELVKQDNSDLRQQLEAAEKAGNKIRLELDEVESMHKTLLGDHSRLQHLHTLLTKDYEQTKNESAEMRTKLRNASAAIQTHTPMVTASLRELEELRYQLSHEKSAKEKQLRAYADLQNEHGAARRQLDNIRAENEHLVRNREALTAELRRARANDSALQWSNLVDDLNKQLQGKDLEIAKLHHKIEALQQLNATYNEENKNLSRQLEILLTQNKELLNRALHDKDQYHLEMKDFQEQLSALRRHKEKLEDKIMDQYRTMESKKSADRKQPLVKRAAKALIRRRASSNTGSTTEDSSAYSADEAPPPSLITANSNTSSTNPNDDLIPTCSSSDDHDRVSPRYLTPDVPARFASFGRSRGELVGGSVRLSNGNGTLRRPMLHGSQTYDHITLREDKPLINLPPRAPIRNTPTTSSLRLRPPPPPYQHRPNNNSRPHQESPPLFQPRCSSTPKPHDNDDHENGDDSLTLMNDSTPNVDRHVVAEGERRVQIREKDDRLDKALSYYENVPQQPAQQTTANSSMCVSESSAIDEKNESTVWYEYGCV